MRKTENLWAMLFSLTILSLLVEGKEPCTIRNKYILTCQETVSNINEPIQWKPEHGISIREVHLNYIKGSIGKKSLSSFPDVDTLELNYCDISEIEEGSLCSSRRIRSISIAFGNWPLLSKKHFRNCGVLSNFECAHPTEEDALEEMSGLQSLSLSSHLPTLTKAYFAPLRQLTLLFVEVHALLRVEPGLFCLPTLECLTLFPRVELNITESLFEGCENVKQISLADSHGVIPPGQSPFRNFTNLESLSLAYTVFTHLGKDFLSGLLHLKKFEVRGNRIPKLVVDADSFVSVPGLVDLELTEAGLKDSDLEALGVLDSLKYLDIQDNELTNIDSIRAMLKLVSLNVSSNKLVRFDAANLKNKFPKLEQLDITRNPLDPDFVKELSEMEFVKYHTTYGNYPDKEEGKILVIHVNYQ